MPTLINDEKMQELLDTATEIDSFDFQGETEDDYFNATLHKLEDGRHFRYVTASGFNSIFAGSWNIGEWLDESEIENWTVFE